MTIYPQTQKINLDKATPDYNKINKELVHKGLVAIQEMVIKENVDEQEKMKMITMLLKVSH